MRQIQQRLCDLAFQARQAQVQANFEEVTVASAVEFHFGINGDLSC